MRPSIEAQRPESGGGVLLGEGQPAPSHNIGNFQIGPIGDFDQQTSMLHVYFVLLLKRAQLSSFCDHFATLNHYKSLINVPAESEIESDESA